MKPRLEFLILGTLLAGLIGLFFWIRSGPEVLLLDRQRGNAGQSDFVLEFLEATQTPYSLREGYVVLGGGKLVEQRLLQLLGCLTRYQELVKQNLQQAQSGAPYQRHICLPNPEGGVEVLATGVSARSEAEDRWLDDSLERQADTVFAAIARLRPGAVRDRGTSTVTSRPDVPMPALVSTPSSEIQQADHSAPANRPGGSDSFQQETATLLEGQVRRGLQPALDVGPNPRNIASDNVPSARLVPAVTSQRPEERQSLTAFPTHRTPSRHSPGEPIEIMDRTPPLGPPR